jgi:hypothetical protein
MNRHLIRLLNRNFISVWAATKNKTVLLHHPAGISMDTVELTKPTNWGSELMQSRAPQIEQDILQMEAQGEQW